MAYLPTHIPRAALVLTLVALCSSVQGTMINVRNQCLYTVTACDQAASSNVTCYALQNGRSHLLNVGAV